MQLTAAPSKLTFVQMMHTQRFIAEQTEREHPISGLAKPSIFLVSDVPFRTGESMYFIALSIFCKSHFKFATFDNLSAVEGICPAMSWAAAFRFFGRLQECSICKCRPLESDSLTVIHDSFNIYNIVPAGLSLTMSWLGAFLHSLPSDH